MSKTHIVILDSQDTRKGVENPVHLAIFGEDRQGQYDAYSHMLQRAVERAKISFEDREVDIPLTGEEIDTLLRKQVPMRPYVNRAVGYETFINAPRDLVVETLKKEVPGLAAYFT